MTPQLLAAEMADLEMAAVAAAEEEFSLGEDTSWEHDQAAYLERIHTVHRLFHADDVEAAA